MTATDPAPLRCPNCGNANTSIGGSGNGMCFDCAHTWDPATEVAPEPAPLEPFGMKPVEDVFGIDPADNPNEWEVNQAELIGGFATLEGGQVAQVVTFTDDERVVVTLATGDTEVVPLADVERIVPPAPAPQVDIVVPPPDEMPAEMQATMLMASQIIDAGIRAARTIEHPGTLLDIPTGYLPDDPALWPVVEQACAVAIGMMIDATDLGVAGFAAWFGIDLEDSDQGDQQEDSVNGQQSS